MPETKFTPGPWLFHAHNGEITDSSPAENRIADVQLEGWHKLGAGYANARLIAAAPELLSLLEEARSTLEMWKDVAPSVSLCADIDKAIARARGEA